MAVSPHATAAYLGGKKTLHRNVRSGIDLHEAVAAGLPVASLQHILKTFGAGGGRVSRDEILRRIVPEGTYKRRLKSGRLSPGESERTERLARVLATGRHVLGDGDLAWAFMLSAHPELRGNTPLEMVQTEAGARQVEEILWKAFYGIPA